MISFHSLGAAGSAFPLFLLTAGGAGRWSAESL
jgi:hypothetical protein